MASEVKRPTVSVGNIWFGSVNEGSCSVSTE